MRRVLVDPNAAGGANQDIWFDDFKTARKKRRPRRSDSSQHHAMGEGACHKRSSASVQTIALARRFRCYFFLPDPKSGCHPAAFWLGAAAIVLIFSFLGFLASRFPFCSPLAMSISFGL